MGPNDQPVIKTIAITILSLSLSLCGFLYLTKKHKYNKQYKRLQVLREIRKLKKYENVCKFSAELDLKDIMTDECIDGIVNKSMGELLELIKTNVLKPEKVLVAFQKKAIAAHSRLNCVVDFLRIDKSEINASGPLYGLPVSVKDNFLVKGYSSCAGCSIFLDKPVDTNSVLIDVLKDLGAVPFVKTTVPQTMMSTMSSNPIDGVTLNPANIKMSPGGSSSGEGALVGAGGSIVGIGTDIGGSVRLPAAFCGVVGFKPTVGRLSKKGLLEISSVTIVTGACGIIGRDVATVSCLFEHIVNSSMHRKLDPLVVPMDFNGQSYHSSKKLKIGYFTFDGSYEVVPAIKRAVLETVERLKQRGHKVVPWQPPFTGERWLSLFLTAIAANAGKDITSICQYDKLDSSIKNLLRMLNWNMFEYFYYLMKCKLFGQKDTSIWLNAIRSLQTATQLMELKSDIKCVRDCFVSAMKQGNIDILICPTSGTVALPVQPSGSTTGMLTYQNIWNLIDFPAGTVPVSRVTLADIDELIKKYPRTNSLWHKNTFENQLESLELPVGVQCVAAPWKDELCLRGMREIEDAI